MYGSLTNGECQNKWLPLGAECLKLSYLPRPAKVAAGQADGIQPRTIEVLQVGVNTDTRTGSLNGPPRVTDSPSDCCVRGTRCT